MVTNVAPYCAIHGYDFTSIVYVGSIEPSGGSVGVEEITTLARGYADIRIKGRLPKKYKITAESADRDEIEAFLQEVNTAPEDAEFYPFEATRFGLIASSYATLKAPKIWKAQYNRYEAEAVITCREPWLYGPDKGIAYDPIAALPYVSDLLENEGHETAPINYIQASGVIDSLTAPVPSEISGSSTRVVLIDTSGYTYQLSGQVWVKIGNVLASKISTSTTETVIIGYSDGYPYRLDDDTFVLLSDSLTLDDISVAEDGTIYGINSGKLWKWSGTAWTDLGGVVRRVTAYDDAIAYVIGDAYDVYKYDSGWTQLSATAVSDLSVASDGQLLSIQSGVAYYWSGSAWVSFGGSNGAKIASTSTGFAWMIDSTPDTWYFGGAWSKFTPAAAIQCVTGLSVRITIGTDTTATDRKLTLCDRLLGDDLFEAGWRKRDVSHSWDADLSKSLANLTLDVHGQVSGGSISSGVLTLDNGDYLMIPFYGPLPMSGEPGAACLEIQVDAITGDGATVQAALDPGLLDMAEVEHDELVVGKNTIYVPDLEGEGLVLIGIKAAAIGSVDISSLKGTVKRYMADGKIPWADPDEEFKIRVESEAGDELAFLEVDYNDRYYY